MYGGELIDTDDSEKKLAAFASYFIQLHLIVIKKISYYF